MANGRTEDNDTLEQLYQNDPLTGAKGVISKKALPFEEVQTGTDEQGRPITRVVPRFVNDSNTLAEVLHQNGGAERIYIPDEVIDDEQINEENIGFAFEKGTGRAYVTWARHSRYQDSPIMANGRTEDNDTLEQLYQNDPLRKERSEAQTKGEGVGLAELDEQFVQELDEAPISELEKTDPDAVARELTKIDSLAAKLAGETVVTNDGAVASVGAPLADLIAQAAKNKYLARLRGIVSGEFADAAGAVRDVKAKALRALKSRGGSNVGVSLDQKVGDGTATVGDITGASQAIQDQQSGTDASADSQIEGSGRPEPQDTSEALQFSLDMAVMELSDADRALWLEFKKRSTQKREGGKGAYRITNGQQRVADMVKARANESLIEMLAVERDVDDTDGALAPAAEQVLTESERAEMDRLNSMMEGREARKLEERIRKQAAELIALGEGSVDVSTILKNIAADQNQNVLVRTVAGWLSKSKHDFSQVKVELVSNRGKRNGWAGLYTAGDTSKSGTIQINIASNHRGGVARTFLHEAVHHAFIYKARPSYKRNAVEQAAYRDLRKILIHARKGVLLPESGETMGREVVRGLKNDETFYGLSNVDELIAEILTNPKFFEWLSNQPALPGLGTKGKFRSLWEQIKQVFKNFFAGVQVRPSSLLSQSLDSIFALGHTPQSDRKIREFQNERAQRRAARQDKVLDELFSEIPLDEWADKFLTISAATLNAAPVNAAAPNPRTAELEEIIQDVVGFIRTPIRAANLKGHPAQARMNANGDLEILYDAEAIAIETENFTEEETVKSVRKLIGHENAHIAALINDYKTADAQGRVGREKIESFHDELMTDEMRQQAADAYVRRYDGMTDAEYQAARQEFLADKMAVAGEYKRMFTERYLTGESYEDFLSNLARKTGDKFADIVRGIADYLIGRIRMLSARYQMVNDPRLAAVLMQDIRMLKNLDNGTNGLLGDRVTGLNILNASSVDPVRINTQQSMPTFGGKMVGRIDLDNLSKIPENDPTLKVLHIEAPIGSEVITVTDFKGLMEDKKNNQYTTPANWARFKGRNTFNLVKTGRELGSDELKAMGVDERFASKAQIQRMKKSAGGWKYSGFFGQGLMDKAVWNRVEQQNAELRGANFRVEETTKKFDKLVKKHKPDSATLQAALGSTDNVLTDAQYDQWKGMTKAAKKETDPTKRKAAMAAADAFRLSQVRANNVQKQADRKAALSQLPQELQDVVESMRTQIDKLSKIMISEGLIGSNLQATLGANMGVYLNRSYEVFDNQEWSDFILTDQSLESQRIRNNAAKLFRSQLVAEEARKIRRDAKLNNQPVPTRQDALAAAQATVTDNDVSLLMQDYLRVGDDAAVALLGGRLPGKADTSIIKLRGQIPREVRELWGEYKDTSVNYAKTYIKMASFIANHQFQKDFYEMGMTRSTPFLWKEGVNQGKRPDHWVEIYKGLSDSPNPNPMAGVYGPPIIVEAFKEANEKFKEAPINQLVTALTGFAMASKTIYNPPQTYVRNFLGNGLIMFSQGYVVTDVTQLGFLKRFGNSAVTTGDRLIGLRPERSEAVTEYIERLTKLGVMGDNVKASVIKEMQSVVFDKNPSAAFGNKLQGAFNALKSGNQRLLDAYQAGDDFWKILAFESERSTFAKAFPQATPESLDRMAADRVRAVVPTYSMIPKGVQDLVKKQPYLAPFISWTSEITRTFLNTWIVAYQDIRSGNPVLMKSGCKRVFFAGLGQIGLTVAADFIRDSFGVSEEDEEALRRFLPEWQVDALLALTGKSEGKLTFWDLSYLNPYSVLQEPMKAFVDEYKKTGSSVDATVEGLQKLLDPWTSEQLLFGAVMDVARGYTKEGYPIYEAADSKWNNVKSGASRLVQAVTPGAVNLPIRISKAIAGEVSSEGTAYRVEDELKGAILGQKPAERDVLQRFQNKNLTKFKLLSSSASNLATKEYRTRGTPDLANIRDNYVQSNNARMQAFKEVRLDVEALEKLGVTKSQAIQAMKARGVPEDDIRQIIAGKYVRRFPGKSRLENAVGLPDFKGRLQALIQARDSYPEVQDFTVGSPTDQ
jgi:hypothetical protein